MADLKIGCQYQRVQTTNDGVVFPRSVPVTFWALSAVGLALITWFSHPGGGLTVAEWVPADELREIPS